MMAILSFTGMDLFSITSTWSPLRYFLQTVIEGKRTAPSSMLEEEMIVFLFSHLKVASIVCQRKREKRMIIMNPLKKRIFFIMEVWVHSKSTFYFDCPVWHDIMVT